MGVRTEADEHRDSAISSVKDAISSLSCIVVDQCCGHDDYKELYRSGLTHSLMELIKIRDRL